MTLTLTLLSILLILAVVGTLCGLLLGSWLLLNPDVTVLLNYSTKDVLRDWQILSRSVRVERFFYRHHRWFGGAIILGSFVTLIEIGTYFKQIELLTMAGLGETIQAWWWWESLIFFVVPGNFFTLTIGVFILLRPSSLKRFESWANHWVDAEGVRQRFLHGVREWPRLFALLLIGGGVSSLFFLVKLFALYSW
ncbi:MAG: hypothetical protein H7839_18125 [Magnetococcus sp. YQC-5]